MRITGGKLLLAALLVAAVMTTNPTSAQAAGVYTCEASAIKGTVLGQPLPETATANKGGPLCINAKSPTAAVLPAPLSVGVLGASTFTKGDTPHLGQQVIAAGGLTDLTVAALPELPIRIPVEELNAVLEPLAAVKVPLPTTGLPPLPLGITLPAELTLDLRPALQALLPDGKLPRVNLLELKGVMAYAAAQCVNGQAAMAGAPAIGDITVLGQKLSITDLANKSLKIDTGTIDPSNIDLALLQLPAPLTLLNPVLKGILEPAIKTALDLLPPITLPTALAQVQLTPGAQVKTADSLVQQALNLKVALLGQSLVDLTIGEAKVATRNVDCAAPAVSPTVADEALACTKKRLVLIDVLQKGGKVRLYGAADKALAGRVAKIRFTATGKQVATAMVMPDGTFETTAPLPARKLRNSNRARYTAIIGREKSMELKLARRMVVQSMEAKNGKVTITGRVIGPFTKPISPIKVQRRVSCKKNETVKTVKPLRDGFFSVTVDAPPNALAATYRLATKVQNTPTGPKYDTFTLPRSVDLTL